MQNITRHDLPLLFPTLPDAPLFLIGMPSVGKTKRGKRWARTFGVPFEDLDHTLAATFGITIPEYWQQYGETAFRTAERDALRRFCDNIHHQPHPKTILATGGGAPCFYDNLERMKDTGTVLWLDTPLASIAERLYGDTSRPIVARTTNPTESLATFTERLNALYDARKVFYRQAHYRLWG